MDIFTDAPEFNGTLRADHDGFTFSAELASDDDQGTPWDNEDGHGPVSDWRRKSWNGHFDKSPGELLLCDDNPSGLRGTSSARFYDFAEACRIARRDGWGVPAYSLIRDNGANGLSRCTGHWFDDQRNLIAHRSDWHDDCNAAISQVYAMHRATMTARQYAALAARADFERLRNFCDGDWHYCGVIVTVSRNGIELASASLWGVESDAGDYLREVADELACEAMAEARDTLESLCEYESAE